MRKFIKQFIPERLLDWIRPYYHGVLAWDAGIYFDRPSERLVVVGITGTAGKSTTTHMLAHILNKSGVRAGYITTVDFFDGKKDYLNKHGLSMPNEITLQRELHAMVMNKCRVAIVECTSEGLAQNRHWGINFDMAMITNLSAAHLEAHGGFEQYRAAKAKLFGGLIKAKRKSFFPRKIIGLNLDDKELKYFDQFKADQNFGISFSADEFPEMNRVYRGREIPGGLEILGRRLYLKLPGEFNLQNALMALAIANELGVSVGNAVESLANFKTMPGRMEEIDSGRGFKIFVDYGCEPVSIKAALTAVNQIPHNRIIHVFGSTGGHRDTSKRFIFGRTSAELADVSIITNDDVYDSDPQKIAEDIVAGIKQVTSNPSASLRAGKLQVTSVETILDRKQAIRRALSIAQPNDIVLITGKGSEQFLVLPGNKRIDWDDREVVREELAKLTSSASP
jgi:UDP-N-acetylmuramoyl-L-alanyl-D-glutamate--2,6-diaminopimelate ligase